MKKSYIRLKARYMITMLTIVIVFVLSSCSKNEIAKEQKEIFIKLFGSTGQNLGGDVEQTSDGGFIISGTYSKINEPTKMYIVKTDNFGNEVWNKQFELKENITCSKLKNTNDGYIVLGSINKSSKNEVYIVRILANGDSVWTKRISKTNDLLCNNVIVTSDGNYLIVGYEYNTINFKDPYWALISENGSVIWEKTLFINGDNWVEDAVQVNDGYVLIGSSNDSQTSGLSDIFAIRTKKDGTQNGYTNIDNGSAGSETGKRIFAQSDGSLICFGNSIPKGETFSEIAICSFKFNSLNVNTNYFKTIKKDGESIDFQDVSLSNDSKYWLSNTIVHSNGDKDFNVLQTDLTGVEIWSNTIFSTGNQTCNSIVTINDGSAIVIGTNEISGNSLITLLKVNNNGKLQ